MFSDSDDHSTQIRPAGGLETTLNAMFTQAVEIVGCHAEGEVGDVIIAGIDPPPGDTVWEQAQWIAGDQTLRNFVLNEPRGGVFRHVNLLVPAKNPAAAIGWIIMEPEDTPPMSGSNSMCVSTVLLETGIIPMTEPETRFTLEAPGGLVDIVAECKDGKDTREEPALFRGPAGRIH